MEEKIIVRNATPADEERILEIALEQWKMIYENYKRRLGDELYAIYSGSVEERLEAKAGEIRANARDLEHCFVTEVDGYVAGFAHYMTSTVNGHLTGIVGHNAVDNRFKGRGIAGRQYALIYEKMREAGCISTMVHTGLDEMHAPARRAYEKSGFSANLPTIMYYMKL